MILVITFIWRRERLPTPVFWLGEFHGLYRPWSLEEWTLAERLSLSITFMTMIDHDVIIVNRVW